MTRKTSDLLVFGGSASPGLTADICRCLRIRPGKCETRQFSEGNTLVRVLENVRGKDVFIVQSLSYPVNDHFMELLFYVDAFKRASADSVTAVMPFLSYSKGDKKDEPRVAIRARVCADCLEGVGTDRVVTMDLHAPQIQGFFRAPVDHLYALPVIARYVRKSMRGDWVVVAPDAGAIKLARGYAKALGAQVAVAEKRRKGHDEKAEVSRIIGDVAGLNALIVDDFAASGGTLVAAAGRLKKEKARHIYAAVSHGVLAAGSAALFDNGPIERLIITDTVEHRFEPLPEVATVVSVAPLFARAIRNIHNRTSVSELFRL